MKKRFLFIGLLVFTILFGLYIYFADSGIWPWFSFYRSKSCLEEYHRLSPPGEVSTDEAGQALGRCFAGSYRTLNDPISFSEAINSTNFSYTATQSGIAFNKLNQLINPDDWECREVQVVDYKSGKAYPVDPNNKDPKMNGVYECWSKEPIPVEVKLTRTAK